jgi:hypothetical protein
MEIIFIPVSDIFNLPFIVFFVGIVLGGFEIYVEVWIPV